MEYRESKIQIVFNWLYVIIVANLLWFLGFFLGLGIFSSVAATVTLFQMYKEMSHHRRRSRLKVWPFWLNHFKQNLKRYWMPSVLFTLGFMILATNYLFFDATVGVIGYALFYVTIFALLLLFFIWLWFTFLSSYYPNVTHRERLGNAVAYTVVHLIEMIVLAVLLVAAFLLIWGNIPGLTIFTGIGASIAAVHWVCKQLVEGRSLRTYTMDLWERKF